MNMFRTLLVAGLVAMAAPAFAQDTAVPQLTDDQAAEVMDFAMHDAVYTLYHESGHLLIHELGLPVLGKEEDAADALGVILIFKNTADKDELFNTLADASDGWYWSAEETTGNGIDDLSYYDDHSLDIQRAYAMVCMMVGAEPDEFREIADDYQLDADQQDACAGTYQQALDSWTTELAPHLAKKPGPEIKVTYQDAATRGWVR